MQQTEATAASTGIERQRVESVVQTLAALHSGGESLAEIAHDARNMVTALGLYCELLEEPGVLVPAFAHYGSELRLVAAASRRLVEKLVTLDNPAATETGFRRSDAPAAGHWPVSLPYGSPLASPPLASHPLLSNAHWDLLPSMPVTNLAAELLATRNLLTALAGPAIALTVSTEGGAQPVGIRCEDLTRVLVNLVKNAVEAMPSGGRIQITLREQKQGLLAVVLEDNGPESLPMPWRRSSNPAIRSTPPRVPRAREPHFAAWAWPSPAPSPKPRAAASTPKTARWVGHGWCWNCRSNRSSSRWSVRNSKFSGFGPERTALGTDGGRRVES